MVSVRGLSIIVITLALLSVVLGWQVYSMRQSAGGQTNVLSQRNAEVSQLNQALTGKDAELARLRQTSKEKDTELAQLKEKLANQNNDLAQAHEANNRANQIYLDVTKQRIWHIRVGQSIAAKEVVLSVVPQANGTTFKMAVALQSLLFGSSRTVRVLTTAPNWGADDKVLSMESGVVRLEYQFPTAVTEATISLAP
jgi:septal ring factor EnvC (AmiA/AmiB activator)